MLDNVVVPGNCLLGGKDELDKRLARVRPVVLGWSGSHGHVRGFASARGRHGAGIARAALEYAKDYALTREAFGGPIADKQAIAFKLAEIYTEIDAARLLVHRAAGMASAVRTWLAPRVRRRALRQ